MSGLCKVNNVEFSNLPTQMNKTITLPEKHENELKIEELKLLENELRKEYEKEIDNLKREVIDAHKQITEWQERYQQLDERFSHALQSKDQAIKINQSLENSLHIANEEIKHLNNEINLLKKEIYPLRQLTFLKLSKDVNAG